MSGTGPVHPFDKTRILPGVPELPSETTRSLPLDPPQPELGLDPAAPEASTPPSQPGPAPRNPALLVSAAAALVLAAGTAWWLLRGPRDLRRGPEIEPVAEALPPALERYREAAEQGDPKAMRMLGACYTYGLGVRVNPAEGASWYRRAAQAGDAVASQELRAAQGGS